MNFSTPDKVSQTIRASDQVERRRASNRVKVNDLFNGAPPLTPEEAKKMNLHINVNWGEGPVLAAHARRQYTNAFQKPGNFFKVSLPLAPEENKTAWGAQITQFINGRMKKSKSYFYLKQEQFANVIAHGPGPQLWYDEDDWEPKGVAIEDLRVPTDTKVSLDGLPWFAVRHRYTTGELSKKAFGKNSKPGWNKPVIKEILNAYHDVNFENGPDTWLTAPEKMAELYKQNFGFYSSDSAPSIPLWHFYYYDDEDPKNCVWKMCVVPEAGVTIKGMPQTDAEFIYESDKPVAQDLQELLFIQFGDLNNKAPFMYHSIRSLGFLLMEPCFWTNMTRCRFLQHVFESFNIWFRSSDPAGRAKAGKIEMFDRCYIPEGISIVPQNERHQINPDLVNNVMAQLKQLMSEASSSYTQSSDTGTQKEQTAYETSVKMSMVNAMMGAMLTIAFVQETFSYREICRRFCREKSNDKDVQAFQKFAQANQIPQQWLNVDLWEVEAEIPLGSGNPSMEMASVSQLMAAREKFDPTAQQEILHDFAEAVTNDPRKAERLVPLGKDRGVTDAQRDAEFAFSTLMLDVPVRMKEGLSPIDQIDTLLGLMAGVIANIEKQTNLATPSELAGLQNVQGYIEGLIAQLAQNQAEKPRVKEYSDVLGKLSNAIKGFAQRLAEQQKQAGQGATPDPQAQAKAQTTIELAQLNNQIKELKAEQARQHNEMDFLANQKRKDEELQAELGRQALLTQSEVERNRLEAASKPKPEPASNGKP